MIFLAVDNASNAAVTDDYEQQWARASNMRV